MSDRERIVAAVSIIEQFGGIDGAHHKQWVLDKVLRTLMPTDVYLSWRGAYDNYRDEDGESYSPWDEGIAP